MHIQSQSESCLRPYPAPGLYSRFHGYLLSSDPAPAPPSPVLFTLQNPIRSELVRALLPVGTFQANHGRAQLGHDPPNKTTHERREQHSSLEFTVMVHIFFMGGCL